MVTFQLKSGAQRPCSVPYKLFLHRRELCRQKSSITDAFETKLRLTNELIIDTIRKNSIHTMDDVNVLSREINYKNKLLEEAPRMQNLKQQKKAEKLQNIFVNGEYKYQPTNVRNSQADTSSHKRKREKSKTLTYKQAQVLEGHSNKTTKEAQSYVKHKCIKTTASYKFSDTLQYQQLPRTKSANESTISSQAFLSSSKNNQNNAQQQRAKSIEARCYEPKTCLQSIANSTKSVDTHKSQQPQGTLHKITTRDRFKEQKYKKYGHHHTNTLAKPKQQLQSEQRKYAKCARSNSWETVQNQQQQINATDSTRVSSTYDRKAYEATSNTTSVRFNGWRSYNHNLLTTQSADYQQLQRHQQISTNNLEDLRYSNKRKRAQFSKPLNRFDDDRFEA